MCRAYQCFGPVELWLTNGIRNLQRRRDRESRAGSPGGQAGKLPPEVLEDLDRIIQEHFNQLAGPTKEEAQKRFEKEIAAFAEATKAGKDEEAHQAMFNAFMICGADVMRDSSPDTQLASEARSCIEAGDWAGAEATMKRRLELNENAEDLCKIAKVHFDLSRLFRLIGRQKDASHHAHLATQIARPADIPTVSALFLDHEAALALERNDVPHAMATASEAVSLLGQEPMFNLPRGRAMTARAECLVANGDLTQAEGDLESSWPLLGYSLFGGVTTAPSAARARWWEVQAELSLRLGNRSEAINALREAAEMRQQIGDGCCGPTPYTVVARAGCLERLAEILQQDGNAAAAEEALSQAKSLRERAHVAATDM